LKYNSAGTTIKIILEDLNTHYKIVVADNGQGIPEHIRNEIFAPFVVGDGSRSAESGM